MRLLALAAAWAMTASTAAGQPRTSAGEQTIPRYIGWISEANALQFLSKVQASEDRVIGLKIVVDSSSDAKDPRRYFVDAKDNAIDVSAGEPNRAPALSMRLPQGPFDREHGEYVIDGFFLVKHGGIFSGVSTELLTPVNESDIRLSDHLRVRDEAVGPPNPF